MIPRFVMSERMKELGRWSFNAWALDGFQKVFWFRTPLAELQTEAAVLLGSAFVMAVLTLMFSGRWKRGM
jgi:ABC-2 type transport system permease protein